MAIDLHDQPRQSYMDYDVTDHTGDNFPYIPRKRGIGPAEVIMFLLVVALCVPIVHWVALTIAEAVA
jgi:hypothetical protein